MYVNLPIKDLQRTRNFWSELGFTFNEQFSDDKAVCLILNEGLLYAMLITEPYFSTFTHKPVADRSSTQVLLAVEVESKDLVDEIMAKAFANGATRYQEPKDHGWMYYDTFEDPDGHQWEIMCTDPNFVPNE